MGFSGAGRPEDVADGLHAVAAETVVTPCSLSSNASSGRRALPGLARGNLFAFGDPRWVLVLVAVLADSELAVIRAG